MANLGQTFDATEHDTTQKDFEELPNGIYRLEVTESDVTPTKDGRGTILKATMEVLEPEAYKARKLFTNFNLQNPSPVAEKIGKEQFASLCRAVDLTTVSNSEMLHNRSFVAKIGLGKASADGKYPARAEIKRYFFEDEGDMPQPAIDEKQPERVAANDNRAPAANDNRQQESQPARATGGRVWGKRG